jgi:hypothetical protein
LASIINASNSGFGGIVSTGDSSGILQLQTAGTTAVTIDTSQNVGIGTDTPTAKLGITAGTLGTAAGNQVAYQTLISNSGNGDFFEITNTRTSAGSDWTTAGTRLQQKIDATYMGYIQFNGGGNAAGMSFGTGTSASATGITERMRIDSSGNLLFNSGYGSVATAYGCRAWVNFNGTGTVAIRGSGNVTSITDNGTGNYAINLTTAMPDLNYSVCSTISQDNTNNIFNTFTTQLRTNSTTSSIAILTGYNPTSPTITDSLIIAVAIFR